MSGFNYFMESCDVFVAKTQNESYFLCIFCLFCVFVCLFVCLFVFAVPLILEKTLRKLNLFP